MNAGANRSSKVLEGVTGLGLAGTIAAFFVVDSHRFWINWIFWFILLATIGLGALFIVALEHLLNVRWSIPVRRVAERISGLLLLVIPVGLLALFSLPAVFPWTTEEGLQIPSVAGKSGWLNAPFFAARVVVSLGLWGLSYRILVGGSFRQDATRDPALSVRARRFAPVFMIIFAFTITIAAFDWISSLEPEWYSDIFGVYLFAGTFLAGLAATTLGVLHLKDRDRLPGVGFDHLYNLGALLFAFTVFWSYIAFAQYMLIWYANLPEEVFWYKERLEGGWLSVVLCLAVFHFLIPFFALVTRDSKGDPRRLRWVAFLVLAAHALDLYWLVFPVVNTRSAGAGHAGPVFGWPELSFTFLFVGAALLAIRRQMRRGADMPVGDPLLAEGLEFHL